MREIQRTIVSAIIFSKDGKLLMGRKDPKHGGVYPDAWHVPGGGIDEGEMLEEALVREVQEEVGIDIRPYQIVPIPIIGHGTAEKTLKETGERVLCAMEFNCFEIRIDDKDAYDIELRLDDDLMEARWFDRKELPALTHVPGAKELFERMGYMDVKDAT